MADNALGQLAQNVFEGAVDETKKTVKAAGTQLGVVKPKTVKVPTQQQIDARAAQAKVETDARLAERRAELASLSTPPSVEQQAPAAAPATQEQRHEQAAEYMKQEAFITAQGLGQAPRQERPRQVENPFSEKKTPPSLEQMPSKGPFGVKKKRNIALSDAQRKTEIKSGKLG